LMNHVIIANVRFKRSEPTNSLRFFMPSAFSTIECNIIEF
jgi:hypothetical protein